MTHHDSPVISDCLLMDCQSFHYCIVLSHNHLALQDAQISLKTQRQIVSYALCARLFVPKWIFSVIWAPKFFFPLQVHESFHKYLKPLRAKLWADFGSWLWPFNSLWTGTTLTILTQIMNLMMFTVKRQFINLNEYSRACSSLLSLCLSSGVDHHNASSSGVGQRFGAL